jgi:hypothetical protein
MKKLFVVAAISRQVHHWEIICNLVSRLKVNKVSIGPFSYLQSPLAPTSNPFEHSAFANDILCSLLYRVT